MRVKKIIAALERWSPHGLCAGVLVKKNGNPANTEGCAVGCLVLDTLYSSKGIQEEAREELEVKKDEDVCHKVFQKVLKGKGSLTDISGSIGDPDSSVDVGLSLAAAVLNRFDLDSSDEDTIIDFNDTCLDKNREDNYCFLDASDNLPKPLREAIFRLRTKHETFKKRSKAAKKGAKTLAAKRAAKK